MSEVASSIVLPITLLVLGAVLGLLSTLLTSSKQQRDTITLKLLEQYFEVRKDVAKTLSQLADHPLQEEMPERYRAATRRKISMLFYQHYDFLPQTVLGALVLMYVALDHPSSGPYEIKEGAIVPMEGARVPKFIAACSLFRNAEYGAVLALKSGAAHVRENQVIILHARWALQTMNQYASMESLTTLIKEFHKRGRTPYK